MDEAWKQVIAFNNAGIHHFAVENFYEALLLFEKSLVQARAILRRRQNRSSQSFKRLGPESQSEESRIQLELRNIQDCPISKESQPAEGDESLVAKCCIWIAEPSGGALSIQDYSTFTLSTVYNIAVTYQLIGIRQQSRQMLEKADKYYRLAWNLQSQIQLRHEVHLSIYLLSNWATLYRSLGEGSTSRQLLQQLYWQLSNLGQLGMIQDGAHDFDIFFRNLLDLMMQPTHAAAAA